MPRRAGLIGVILLLVLSVLPVAVTNGAQSSPDVLVLTQFESDISSSSTMIQALNAAGLTYKAELWSNLNNNVPSSLPYKAVILTATNGACCQLRDDKPILESYVHAGGGLVILKGAIFQMGTTTDDQNWLGASSVGYTETEYATVKIDHPLGTSLLTGQLLVEIPPGDVGAQFVSGLASSAQVLAIWSGGGVFSYAYQSGPGRVFYSAGVEPQAAGQVGFDNLLALLTAGVEYVSEVSTLAWSEQGSGTMGQLSAVKFIDARSGWAAGELCRFGVCSSIILHTSDGGAQWSTQLTSKNSSFRISRGFLGLDFVDASHGWAVGGSFNYCDVPNTDPDCPSIAYTNDGGLSWSPQNGRSNWGQTAVDFIDSMNGWAVGGGTLILHTSDGGANWVCQYEVYNYPVLPCPSTPTTTGPVLRGVHFVSASEGWTVGERGTILHTTDGGLSWSSEKSGTSQTLRGVDFIGPASGWAVGDGGLILHSSDGATWRTQVSVVDSDLLSVDFVSSQNGWVVGANGVILQTVDGGSHWSLMQSGVNVTLRSVSFPDAISGWVVGDDRVVLHSYLVLRTPVMTTTTTSVSTTTSSTSITSTPAMPTTISMTSTSATTTTSATTSLSGTSPSAPPFYLDYRFLIPAGIALALVPVGTYLSRRGKMPRPGRGPIEPAGGMGLGAVGPPPNPPPQPVSDVPSTLSITRADVRYLVEYRPAGERTSPLTTKLLVEFDPNKRERILKRIDELTMAANVLALVARGKPNRGKPLPPDYLLASLKDIGGVIFDYFLSGNAAMKIRESRSQNLIIETNDIEIPWEIMYDGSDFLSLKHYVGRALVVETDEKPMLWRGEIRKEVRTALIIDPTDTLPAAKEEANLTECFSRFGTVDVYEGGSVDTVQGMKIFGRGTYDIIHFAGHAEIDVEKPSRSSLGFSDGKLTAGEIKRIIDKNASKPKLIFVNACTSARESREIEVEYQGHKISGLASLFLKAGALGYIGTTWTTFDRPAQFLASEFYARILSGEAVGMALTEARRKTFEAHPNDLSWASFILYGDPSARIFAHRVHS